MIAIFDLEGRGLTIDVEGSPLNVRVLFCRRDEKSKVVGAVFSNAGVQDVDAELFSSGLNSIHFFFRSELPKVVVGYVAFAIRMDKVGAPSLAGSDSLGVTNHEASLRFERVNTL